MVIYFIWKTSKEHKMEPQADLSRGEKQLFSVLFLRRVSVDHSKFQFHGDQITQLMKGSDNHAFAETKLKAMEFLLFSVLRIISSLKVKADLLADN